MSLTQGENIQLAVKREFSKTKSDSTWSDIIARGGDDILLEIPEGQE